MLNPYVVIGLILAWLASLWTVGSWQRDDGRLAERTAWQARESAELTEANRLLFEAQQENTALKAAHEERIAAIATNITQEEARHEERTRAAVRGARALVLRQQPRDPGAGQAGGRAAPAPSAAPGSCDATPACELPAPAVRDLLQLVSDADRDVRQLAACQATVTEYHRYAREACGPTPTKGETQ